VTAEPGLRTEEVPTCLLCQTEGIALYVGLSDRVFGAPGLWGFLRCPRCGVAWLSPRPIPEDISIAYKSYYTHTIPKGGEVFWSHFHKVKGSGTFREMLVRHYHQAEDSLLAAQLGYKNLSTSLLHRMLGYLFFVIPCIRDAVFHKVAGLKANERGKLLDVGCGSGAFLALMRDLGWVVQGIEPDSQAATFARRQFNLEVFEGVLEQAGFADNSFDAVHVSHVVEHVYDPARLLRECRRVLRPTGKLIVTTPNINSLGHRVFGEAWRGLEPPRHLYVFSPDALEACASGLGFTVEKITTITRMARGIWYASRLIQKMNRDGQARNSVRDYFESYMMPLVEDLVGVFSRSIGEEIVLIAFKP
jgi:2-polyprenyl-3-methyl-5-hydroxy-6-metoxy-1,4-benzoquinol methylase